LHKKFGITATSRASFYIYNTQAEIDQLIEGLYKVKEVYG
jgi:cysteine desulfurase / selenocysteine lyase